MCLLSLERSVNSLPQTVHDLDDACGSEWAEERGCPAFELATTMEHFPCKTNQSHYDSKRNLINLKQDSQYYSIDPSLELTQILVTQF